MSVRGDVVLEGDLGFWSDDYPYSPAGISVGGVYLDSALIEWIGDVVVGRLDLVPTYGRVRVTVEFLGGEEGA